MRMAVEVCVGILFFCIICGLVIYGAYLYRDNNREIYIEKVLAAISTSEHIYSVSGWDDLGDIPDGMYLVTFDNGGIDELLFLRDGKLYVPKLFAKNMLKVTKDHKPTKFKWMQDNSAHFQRVK